MYQKIARRECAYCWQKPTTKNKPAGSEFPDRFKNYYGPTVNAFEAAEENGKAADLQHKLEALFNRHTAAAYLCLPASACVCRCYTAVN